MFSICIGLIFGSGSVAACERVVAQLDNDFTLLRDEGYSNGLRLGCRLKELSAKVDAPSRRHFEVFAGHSIYTPGNISRKSRDLNDQPYAAHLFLQGGMIKKSPAHLTRLDLQIGAVGPDVGGEWAQKTIHRVGQFPKPNGWRHQIGHELTLNAKLGRMWRVPLKSNASRLRFFALPHGWLAAGNVLAAAGAGAMLAVLQSAHEEEAIFPYFNELNAPVSEIPYSKSASQIIGFVGIEGQATARNMFLDGPLRADGHQVDKENATFALRFGIEARFQQWAIGFNQVLHTQLFEGDEPHGYGTFYVSVPF